MKMCCCVHCFGYKSGVPVVSRFLKRALFVFNFLSWIMGFSMLCIGIYAKIEKEASSENLSNFLLDPVTPIIFVGSVIFIVSFFGCVGALRENLCMLRFFTVFLLIVLIVELGIAFQVLATSPGLRKKVEAAMRDGIAHYRDDPDLQNIIDWGQPAFKCCGVNSVYDWNDNIYFNCSELNPSMEKCGVPFSCCFPPDDGVVNTLCGMDVMLLNVDEIQKAVYTDGCLENLFGWIQSNLFLLACLLVALGCVPQIIGILVARILVLQIKDQEFYIKIGLLNSREEMDLGMLNT